jgi:hypothetical protein
MTDLFDDVSTGADFSLCRTWRYRLQRRWTDGPLVAFILLNPSTADETLDDPTIRRCIGYAKGWGYGGLVLGNIFAFRATDPKVMKAAADPVGPDNDAWLEKIAGQVGMGHLVCGWGGHGEHQGRGKTVMERLIGAGHLPKALTLTGNGMPGHPLYLRADLEPFVLGRP